MKLFPGLAAAAVVLIFPRLSSAATDFASYYPESTVVYVEAADLKKLQKIGGHPVAEVFASDTILQAILEMAGAEEISERTDRMTRMLKEETGLVPEALLAHFPRGISAALFDVKLAPLLGSSSTTYGYAAVADFSGDEELVADLINAMERLDEKETPLEHEYEVSTADHAGTRIHVLKEKLSDTPVPESGPPDREPERTEYAWAVTGGKVFFATGAETLKEMLGRGADKNAASLARNSEHRSLAEAASPADLLITAPVRSLLNQALDLVKQADAKGPPTTVKLAKALELDAFHGVAARIHFAEAHLDLDLLATYDTKPALLGFYTADGPGKAPWFLPPDVTSTSYGTFSFSTLWTTALAFIEENLQPVPPELRGVISTLNSAAGISIEKDILSRLGKNIFQATISGRISEFDHPADELFAKPAFPLSGPDDSYVAGIETTDGKALDQSLKSIFAKLMPGVVKDRAYQGFTIRNFSNKPKDLNIGWVIAGDWILLNIGQPDLLEKVLSRMAKGQQAGGDDLWSTSQAKAALAALPSTDQVSADFSRFGSELELMADSLAIDEDSDSIWTALARLEFPVVSVEKLYIGGKLARASGRIMRSE